MDCFMFQNQKVTQRVSQSVSEWQGHLLSCSGQLKTVRYIKSKTKNARIGNAVQYHSIVIIIIDIVIFCIFAIINGPDPAYIKKAGLGGQKNLQIILIFHRKFVSESETALSLRQHAFQIGLPFLCQHSLDFNDLCTFVLIAGDFNSRNCTF